MGVGIAFPAALSGGALERGVGPGRKVFKLRKLKRLEPKQSNTAKSKEDSNLGKRNPIASVVSVTLHSQNHLGGYRFPSCQLSSPQGLCRYGDKEDAMSPVGPSTLRGCQPRSLGNSTFLLIGLP